jgi:hypothetical protein
MLRHRMMHWQHPMNQHYSQYTLLPVLAKRLLSVFLASHRSLLARAASGFVTRCSTQFTSNLSPFRFAGSNNSYPKYSSPMIADDLFANAPIMGLSTLRAWAFDDMSSLDSTQNLMISDHGASCAPVLLFRPLLRPTGE